MVYGLIFLLFSLIFISYNLPDEYQVHVMDSVFHHLKGAAECPIFSGVGIWSVTVHWFHPQAYHVESFHLFMQKPGGKYEIVYSGKSMKFKVENLEPGTRYLFCVGIMWCNGKISKESACERDITTIAFPSNLISNPSFEQELLPPIFPHDHQPTYESKVFAPYWEPFMHPYDISDFARTGKKSLLVDSNHFEDKWGVSQHILLNQTEPSTMIFSGYCSSRDVTSSKEGTFGVTIDLLHQDGTIQNTGMVNCSTGTHSWERLCMMIHSSKSLFSATIYITFNNHRGKAWFDDFSFHEWNFVEDTRNCVQVKERSISPIFIHSNPISLFSKLPPKENSVSIVSQLTVDRLDSLDRLLKNWDGPICASIYVLNDDEMATLMKFSYQEHVQLRADLFLISATKEQEESFQEQGYYPVNFLRNIAFNNCRTKYALPIDIDFIPSKNAYNYINEHIELLENKKVLVVPAFEGDSNVIPKTKNQLIEYVKQGSVRQVHKGKWDPAHSPTNYEYWLQMPSFNSSYSSLSPLPHLSSSSSSHSFNYFGYYSTVSPYVYEVKWQAEYEPYIVVPIKNFPKWDERFIGYGFDKVSHIAEVQMAGYQFWVLPDVFILHLDHGVPNWRKVADQHLVRVYENYISFLWEKDMKYKTQFPSHWKIT